VVSQLGTGARTAILLVVDDVLIDNEMLIVTISILRITSVREANPNGSFIEVSFSFNDVTHQHF
jgi:hypothetical protein